MSEPSQTSRRQWDTGLIRPYRACPRDFRERFLELGQSKEIEEHYRTNWRVIRRWIEEAGGADLRADRFANVAAKKRTGGCLHPGRRSKLSLWDVAA